MTPCSRPYAAHSAIMPCTLDMRLAQASQSPSASGSSQRPASPGRCGRRPSRSTAPASPLPATAALARSADTAAGSDTLSGALAGCSMRAVLVVTSSYTL
jgi:hypothetical protein